MNDHVKSQTYKAAIIGCGRIAGLIEFDPLIKKHYKVATHAGAYELNSKTHLVASCDIDESTRKLFSKKFPHLKIYESIEKMLDSEKPEIVSVATSPFNRYEVFKKIYCCASVKIIFSEKPLSNSYEESLRIKKIVESGDKSILVNYIRRFDEGHQRVRELIQTKKIGNIEAVHIIYSDGLLNTASHMIDLMLWYFEDVKKVVSLGQRKSIEKDPVHDAVLVMQNGIKIHLSGVSGSSVRVCDLLIYGSEGMIKITKEGFNINVYESESHPRMSNRMTYSSHSVSKISTIGEAMVHSVEACVDLIEKKTTNYNSFLDALKVQLILSCIKEPHLNYENINGDCEYGNVK